MMKKNDAMKSQKLMTREAIVDRLAETTGLSRAQVGGVLVELAGLAKKSLDQGPDEFTLPGLLKLKIVRKPATETKPARNVLQVVPSKELKDIVDYRWG